jgi:hypothetical protein
MGYCFVLFVTLPARNSSNFYKGNQIIAPDDFERYPFRKKKDDESVDETIDSPRSTYFRRYHAKNKINEKQSVSEDEGNGGDGSSSEMDTKERDMSDGEVDGSGVSGSEQNGNGLNKHDGKSGSSSESIIDSESDIEKLYLAYYLSVPYCTEMVAAEL